MNTDNLNKSQIDRMCDKIFAAHKRHRNLFVRICLICDIELEKYDPAIHTILQAINDHYYSCVSPLFDRIFNLRKEFDNDSNLCAYCCNHIDHNLGDHKLAVERQKITNSRNDLNNRLKRIDEDVNKYMREEHLEDDFEAFLQER